MQQFVMKDSRKLQPISVTFLPLTTRPKFCLGNVT